MRLLINRRPVLATLVLLAVLDCRLTLRAAEQRVADPKELPRFQPVAAGDALNSFQLRKGFHLELVAAEPLVTDPIAFAFDEDRRLFVVEMNDYPDRKQHLGRIRRLVDTDGDGRFDKGTVFAKDLRWPSAINCYGGGVFVGSVPVNGKESPDTIKITASAGVVGIAGLAAEVRIAHPEVANDKLIVNGLGGVDSFSLGPSVTSLIGVTLNQ